MRTRKIISVDKEDDIKFAESSALKCSMLVFKTVLRH